MTLVLCAQKQGKDLKNSHNYCFGLKQKQKNKFKNMMKTIDLGDDLGSQYIIQYDYELASGYVVSQNSIVLGWSGHTFGVINELIEKPIRIPTFDCQNEYMYDSLGSIPNNNLSLIT